ncbi:hypothetical protein NMY22_g10124 [Coprinellus aureogranulatus]|nr:hypothetical protein NMY22_g10124 [Coprinellus aureogranulatus]
MSRGSFSHTPIWSSSTIIMQGMVCTIPSNPHIVGVWVRIAIYFQNLLCFIQALWPLWGGKVTVYEVYSTGGLSTTNLFLGFAILTSCIVQALTVGIADYGASIVLSLSWMTNTGVFVHFLLYVQYRSQEDIEPKLSAWVNRIKPERWVHGMFRLPYRSRKRSGPHRESAKDAYKVLIKQVAIVFSSLHLSMTAAFGIWLRSTPKSFGRDEGARCAFDVAELAILRGFVPFGKDGLRVFSLILYSLFLIPGINLIIPAGAFLSIYCLASHQRLRPSIPPASRAPPTHPTRANKHVTHTVTPLLSEPSTEAIEMHPLREHSSRSAINPRMAANYLASVVPQDLEVQTQTLGPQPQGRIAKLRQVIPVGTGLIILLCINIMFIVDIELTLRRIRHYQDDASGNKTEWAFGQILAMVLVFLPLIVQQRRELQTKLNESLIKAIKSEDVEQISCWVYAGADVNVQGGDGKTALEVTTLGKRWELVRFIVEAGANANRRFRSGRSGRPTTPLRAALEAEAPLSIIEAMLVQGADPDTQGSLNDHACLHQACQEGREYVVALLVNYGANPNIQGPGNWTPLHYACDRGHTGCAQIILEAKATINAQASGGWTALHLACYNGRVNCVRLLLQHGANTSVKNVVELLHLYGVTE